METDTKTSKGSRTDGRLLTSRIDMPENTRKAMSHLLNAILADLFDLYSLTKQAHWNVKGEQFHSLHKLYDEIAEPLLTHVDEVAERITALGGVASGTVKQAAHATRLGDIDARPLGSMESVHILAERYAAVGKSVREGGVQADEAEDLTTSDLLVEVSRDLDKYLWFLEAHLQEE